MNSFFTIFILKFTKSYINKQKKKKLLEICFGSNKNKHEQQN